MDLIYFQVKGGNFGDDLNEWLWDELLPGFHSWRSDTVLVGVGTILKKGLLPEGRRKLVIGSGVGYGQSPDIHSNPDEWDIRCVRGPLTAARLGLAPEFGLADPAILLPGLPEFSEIASNGETLFVPHHASLKNFEWDRICAGTGIIPVSPAQDSKSIIRRIAGAEKVIAESMHAAIIADAFGVPWQCVAVSRAFNDFKWADWAASLNVEFRTRRFFPLLRRLQAARTRFRAPLSPEPATAATVGAHGEHVPASISALLAVLARRTLLQVAEGAFNLSERAVFEQRVHRFQSLLNEIRRDHAA